mmetsp:Transcript_6109/g.7987  ORF Transcript_6109/g.7987 Transcript_6109/m.7987 type:complete len:85 (+) Transcript_6109:38-292(+)
MKIHHEHRVLLFFIEPSSLVSMCAFTNALSDIKSIALSLSAHFLSHLFTTRQKGINSLITLNIWLFCLRIKSVLLFACLPPNTI